MNRAQRIQQLRSDIQSLQFLKSNPFVASALQAKQRELEDLTKAQEREEAGGHGMPWRDLLPLVALMVALFVAVAYWVTR